MIAESAARVRFRDQTGRQRARYKAGVNFDFYEFRLTRRAKQWHYAMLPLSEIATGSSRRASGGGEKFGATANHQLSARDQSDDDRDCGEW
ncbi:hypothetical protein RAD15_41110 [Bradyrhizobium sp. 14AA]